MLAGKYTSKSILNKYISLLPTCPGELGLERGPVGAQVGAPGLDELENGGN